MNGEAMTEPTFNAGRTLNLIRDENADVELFRELGELGQHL